MVVFDPYGRNDPPTLDGSPKPLIYACAKLGRNDVREAVFRALEREVAEAVWHHFVGDAP